MLWCKLYQIKDNNHLQCSNDQEGIFFTLSQPKIDIASMFIRLSMESQMRLKMLRNWW